MSEFAEKGEPDDKVMCADGVGRRYCANDHSDPKYFGRGMNGERGENIEVRFLVWCLRKTDKSQADFTHVAAPSSPSSSGPVGTTGARMGEFVYLSRNGDRERLMYLR